jgi:Flp pilus assembly protein TadB
VKLRPEDEIDFNPMYGKQPKTFGMEPEIFSLFIFSWIAGLAIFAVLSYAGVPFALFPTISIGGFMTVVMATGGKLSTAIIRLRSVPIYIRSAARYQQCFPKKIKINRRRSRR